MISNWMIAYLWTFDHSTLRTLTGNPSVIMHAETHSILYIYLGKCSRAWKQKARYNYSEWMLSSSSSSSSPFSGQIDFKKDLPDLKSSSETFWVDQMLCCSFRENKHRSTSSSLSLSLSLSICSYLSISISLVLLSGRVWDPLLRGREFKSWHRRRGNDAANFFPLTNSIRVTY